MGRGSRERTYSSGMSCPWTERLRFAANLSGVGNTCYKVGDCVVDGTLR